MFDVLVRNGRVFHSEGDRLAHIGIRNGAVEAVLTLGEPASAVEEIDASDKYILPGLVDAHVHLREPGLEHKEGFETGTRAAALGGVTTVMVMPTDKPWTASASEFERKRALAEGKVHVDLALQAAAGPEGAEIERLADLGAVSFEIFLTGGLPEFLVTEDADLLALLERVRDSGGIAGITAGSPGMVARTRAAAVARGEKSVDAFARCFSPAQEALGVARACTAAAAVRCPVHIRQVSCQAAVEVLERFADIDALSAEVTPHHLVLSDDDALRLGPFGVVIPPLRPAAVASALCAALGQGTIDIVATDHAPHLPEEKERGAEDIWRAPPGFPGLQTFLPIMLALIDRGDLDWSDVARTCAERPARLFRLFPRKGHLGPGADADLVIVDPGVTTQVRNEDQASKAEVTPFDGWCVGARVDRVLLRGRTIVADGEMKETKAAGKFVRPG